jgi:plastocyanin
MWRALVTFLAFVGFAGTAMAGDLTVVLKTASGQPVSDAVATLTYASAPRAAPIRFAWPMTMSQHNIQFEPFVLVVPVGSDVVFPNLDKVRHHVYSFSPTKKFELKLYGKEQARTVNFDKIGAVALGCNIHDQMVAFIRVVDTPYAAKSVASGEAVLRGAPAGPAILTIWHPYLKTPKNELQIKVNIGAAAARQAVTVDLRPGPGGH